MAKFSKIAVVGMGKVGSLVATLLKRYGFDVTGIDVNPRPDLPIEIKQCDITSDSEMEAILKQFEAVVTCLPFNLCKNIARIAHKVGIHYFDLTEDVETTNIIRELSKTSKGVMAPQCGLAPGFIGIVGAGLASTFDKIRSIDLKVGALPQHPNGLLGYAFNWSAEGVVNEYLNDCEVIRGRRRCFIPPMEERETVMIKGLTLEAFTTSGGLGTMCETYEGKVERLNYKTMRYIGHCQLMRFFFYELYMKDNRELAGQILVNAKPPVTEDVVYVHASVEGWRQSIRGSEILCREEYVKAYYPVEIDGVLWRAISWTTASSVVAVVEMVVNGVLQDKGFLKQEEIPFSEFLKTQAAEFYNLHEK